MTDQDEVIRRLHARRDELNWIKTALSAAREAQAGLQSMIDDLLAAQREARDRRQQDVRAADAANVPRARIAKEVGMQRGNLYLLLDPKTAGDNTRED